MTVGEAWGDGGHIKEQFRSGSAECVLISESLCGKDPVFRKGGKRGGGCSR